MPTDPIKIKVVIKLRVNCLKTLNKLSICLPGKTPSAPSDIWFVLWFIIDLRLYVSPKVSDFLQYVWHVDCKYFYLLVVVPGDFDYDRLSQYYDRLLDVSRVY